MDSKQPGDDVDLGGLRMFAVRLQAETERGWRPGATRAGLELDHEARFGLACPGGPIVAARVQFGLVLERALKNTAQQIRAAENLAGEIQAALAGWAAAQEQPSPGLEDRSPA